MNGCIGLHVVSKVWVQISMRNISKDEDDGASSRLEDVMKGGPDVVSRPFVDDVIVGQDDDGPLAVARGLADGVRHVGGLGQVGVVKTNTVGRIRAVFQLRTQNLRHKMFIFDAVTDVGVVHLLMFTIRHGARVADTCSPLGVDPYLQLRSENRGNKL